MPIIRKAAIIRAVNILLFGANGQVGWELQRALLPLGRLTALAREDADLANPVADHVLRLRPDVVVNAAAYTAVDKAEAEPELAQRVNAGAVGELAQACEQIGALFVHYSTDYVFDGTKETPYAETDPTAPLNTYGRSKLDGENAIRAIPFCRHLIFRTSWVYAARGRNFARTILQRAQERDHLEVIADTFGAPTSAELIADVTALAIYRFGQGRDTAPLGTFHLVPSGSVSWHGYAQYLVETAHAAGMPVRVRAENVVAVSSDRFPAPARRPQNSRLDNGLLQRAYGVRLPPWQSHVARMVQQIASTNAGA